MRRLTGSALAVVLVVVIGREARAQSVVTARGPGGFGQEYTQSPPSNSVLLDRWWMLEMTPAVGSAAGGTAGRGGPGHSHREGDSSGPDGPIVVPDEQPAVRPRRRSGRDPVADGIAVLAGSRDGAALLAGQSECDLRARLWCQPLREHGLRYGVQGVLLGLLSCPNALESRRDRSSNRLRAVRAGPSAFPAGIMDGDVP